MQDHVRTSAALLGHLLHRVLGRAVARPAHRLRALLIGAGDDLHLVGHHESRIESEAEMPDDRVVLILLEKLLRPRKSDLVDILVDLLGRHADSLVRHGQHALVRIELHANRQIAQLALELARRGERLELLRRVHRVGDQLAQENLLVRIEEFLNDRKDVFGRYANFAVLHDCMCFYELIFNMTLPEQLMCHCTGS